MKFESPKFEIILFDEQDIVTVSGNETLPDDNTINGDGTDW